jgi:hypothetical protein
MEDVGKIYYHYVYFTAIWYISRLFGIFSPVLVRTLYQEYTKYL